MGLPRNFPGDRFAAVGYWSPQTSQVNFCEEDYTITIYIAEVVNSLTNLAYVYYALTTLPPASSPRSSSSSTLPRLFSLDTNTLPNLALLSVGISSLIFHTTLKHTTQLADDLSMFWVCAAIIYELYTPSLSFSARSLFAASLVGSLALVSFIHITGDVLWLHTLTFGVLVTAIWPRTIYLIRLRLRGEEKRDAMRKFRVGGLCFLAGFGLWLLDCGYCGWLRETRAQVGLPWAWVLELHGWWHILTAVGAGRFVELAERVTRGLEKEAKDKKGQ